MSSDLICELIKSNLHYTHFKYTFLGVTSERISSP